MIADLIMNDRYKESFETWNKLANLYQDKFMDLTLFDDTYDFICNSLNKPNSAILEIGCGPGNISRYLLSKRPDFKILGIDVAPNMIELAERNNPNAKFSVMDCRDIGTLHATFDGIICGFCLPYLSHGDGHKLIDDAMKMLNEHGIIYLSFVEGDPVNSGFQVASTGDRSYFHYYTLNQIQSQFLENSDFDLKIFRLEFKRAEDKSEMHTIIIAKKIKASKTPSS